MNGYKLLLHVDKEDGSLPVAFKNAVNFAAALAGEDVEMVLVVNSGAVLLLKKENAEIGGLLAEACERGLSVRVCNNALKAKGIRPDELYPQCSVVPAGIVELVRLQGEGFAYVKP